MLVGGESATTPLDTALVYDVNEDVMIDLGRGLDKGARTMLTANWVADQGYIYIAGGFSDVGRNAPSNAIDVYDVNSLTFVPKSATEGLNLQVARGGHTSTGLDGSMVFLAGGYGAGGAPLGSIELIHQYYQEVTDPATGATRGELVIDVAATPDGKVPGMSAARAGVKAVTLDSGMALVVGGVGGSETVRGLELYNPPVP